MNGSPFIIPKPQNLAETIPEVATYADLPDPLTIGKLFYYVSGTTGIPFFNRKILGIYKNLGSTWQYVGDTVETLSGRLVATTGPLAGGGTLSGDLTLNLPQATAIQNGYLSLADFILFTGKQQVYFSCAVAAGVVENDIVKNAVNQLNGQAPLNFVLASADADYWAIIGVAKNVSGGFADIYVSGRVTGFNFGAFVGVEYYIDPANPGKLTWTPPSIADPIKIGRALDSTSLILVPHQQREFVQLKGGLYTSDGHWDDVLAPGTNGSVLVADSAQTLGNKYAPAVVASAPFTYTTATRTLTIATATNAAAGVLSAADHTTYSGYAATIALKAPLASPVFTGDVNASTGNLLASTIGKGLQVKRGLNAKAGTVALVAGVAVVANTSVTANSLIFPASQVDGGTVGFLRISSKTNGVGFTITSSNILDTSTVAWTIIESIP